MDIRRKGENMACLLKQFLQPSATLLDGFQIAGQENVSISKKLISKQTL